MRFAAEKLNYDDEAQYYSQKLMEENFPEETRILKQTYKRGGDWVRPLLDNGAIVPFQSDGMWMLRVSLWKLQTACHRDVKDLICLLFCMGEFEGGEAILPDLKLKLA